MPYYAVVVNDAQRAHEREIYRNVEHNVAVHGERHRVQVERAVRARYQHGPRPAGTLHCHGERGCPDGASWCEHCGDPAHVEACLAAGHCEACVRLRHGAVAHPAVLEANGYTLVEVGIEALEPHPVDVGQVRVNPSHIWDATARAFVKG
jgi:hypothetical protein